MEKKNNSNILWIVVVVIVAIIALGIGWYLGGKNNEKTPEQAENEVKEQVKNDDEIFADVEKKMEYLYQMDQLGNKVLFAKDRTVDQFEEKDLLYPVLFEIDMTSLNDYSCYDPKTKKLAEGEECGNGMIGEVTGYIETQQIAERFKNLYGMEFSKKDQYNGCPMLLITDDGKGYYSASPCGGTGFDTEYHYIYNKEIKDGKVYIYVAYGVDDCCREVPKIFTDFKKKREYKGKVTEDFKITEDNYKEFSKYKLTFEEKDGNYHFAAIELIEEK